MVGTLESPTTDPTVSPIRWAGLAGMAFAVSVAVQNIWAQAAGLDPEPDASAAEVLAKVAAHEGAYALRVGWVAVNLLLLVVFLAGAHERLRGVAASWSRVGLIGGVLVCAFFALVNVPLVALATGTGSLGGSPELVDVLWHAHGALFAFAGIALGLALLGFSMAAWAAGLVPSWWRTVGPLGALVMVAGSVPVQGAAEGSELVVATIVGFVVWLVFLVIFGARLWRSAPRA